MCILCGAAEFRRGVGKNQSKAQGVKSKNLFFQNFLYLFQYKYLQIYCLQKTRVFQPNAQVRPSKGDVCFRNAMKKQNTIFTFNFYLFTLYSLCRSLSAVALAKAESINIEWLCKTNPIPEKPKMNLNFYSTKDYENKSGLLTMEKQTQSNPISICENWRVLSAYGGFMLSYKLIIW